MIYLLLFLTYLLVGLNFIWSLIKGVRNYIFLFFFSFVQLFYLVYAPTINIFNKNYFAFESYIGERGYLIGLIILDIHILLFTTSYHLTKRKIYQVDLNKIKQSLIRFLFILVVVLFVINSFVSEVSLYQILIGIEFGSTLGFQGATYWFSMLADSLITLNILLIIYDRNSIFKFLGVITSLAIFLILGFRYRFILFGFGIILYLLKIGKIRISKLAIYSFVFFGVFMFFSENRIPFYTGKYEQINYNPLSFDYDNIYYNAQGSIVDFAIENSIINNKQDIDYGKTIFIYPFITILPASFFKDMEKPYPAPQMLAIDTALNVPREYGQAVSLIGMSFYGFSFIGLFFFSVLFGFFVKRFETSDSNNVISFVSSLVIVLAFFQLYTRGYFSQFLMHLFYLYLPLYILKSNKVNE
jgi:hypothetical protein